MLILIFGTLSVCVLGCLIEGAWLMFRTLCLDKDASPGVRENMWVALFIVIFAVVSFFGMVAFMKHSRNERDQREAETTH